MISIATEASIVIHSLSGTQSGRSECSPVLSLLSNTERDLSVSQSGEHVIHCWAHYFISSSSHRRSPCRTFSPLNHWQSLHSQWRSVHRCAPTSENRSPNSPSISAEHLFVATIHLCNPWCGARVRIHSTPGFGTANGRPLCVSYAWLRTWIRFLNIVRYETFREVVVSSQAVSQLASVTDCDARLLFANLTC